MKKLLSYLLVLLGGIILTACNTTKYYYIGVSFYPMDELAELILDDLKEAGFPTKINYYSNDYVTPNHHLKNNEIDINLIQHELFMNEFNSNENANLVIVQPIYHAIFALYSSEYESVEDIPLNEEVTLTIPNDVTNIRRALYLLNISGLIELPEDKLYNASISDVLPTSKINFTFDQVPLNTLSQRYVETKLAIMYPTYARDLQLVGDQDRIYLEPQTDFTNMFAISAVSREDNRDSEFVLKFIELITQDKVRDYLINNYSWAAQPAF